MFTNKKRIDDDLEIARRAFVNPAGFGKVPEKTAEKKPTKEVEERESRVDDGGERLGFSDFLGLCAAAFWVIMPWAVAFAVLLGLTGWLVTRWLG